MKWLKRVPWIAIVAIAVVSWSGARTEATTRATPVATVSGPKKDVKQSVPKKTYLGKVTRVSDGNTIWLTTDKGVRVKVWLDGIDAPAGDQPFARKATASLRSLVGGKRVRVEYAKSDPYGCVSGVVFLDKEDVNLKMVTDGCAWNAADKNAAYAAAETAAKAAKKGLWAAADPISPARWRKGERPTRN